MRNLNFEAMRCRNVAISEKGSTGKLAFSLAE